MKILKLMLDDIDEFIENGEYNPSEAGLLRVAHEVIAQDNNAASDILSESLNGSSDDSLSRKVLNLILFENASSHSRQLVVDELCSYIKAVYMDKYEDDIWQAYHDQYKPDPMTEGKERDLMDEIADNLKGVF